ncbi:MAG: hypothetical protein ACOYXT_00835 [Bacteroidota bacterium]
MSGKKIFLLFCALVLPIGIFIFLKFFGKNEFAVKPLFVDEAPVGAADCAPVSLPYHVPDSILQNIIRINDSLAIVYFESAQPAAGAKAQLERITVEFANDPLNIIELAPSAEQERKKKCVFFLSGINDLVLVDQKGLIRGHYTANDREEVDRLNTEISIILKKY